MSRIVVDATLENLSTVIEFVNSELEACSCPRSLCSQVDIIVEEIYVNIAHYAYHPDLGEAAVCCDVGGDPLQVILEFIDYGRPYNPLDREDPDVTLPLEERQVGGLGIFMVKNMVDDIRYQYMDGKNVLTIHKKVEE